MKGKTWTESDIETLRSMYADHTNAVIAQKLGRTLVSVDQRAHLMRLKKPAAYHAAQSPLAERFTPNYAFKPVDTSDLPRWEYTFKPLTPMRLAPFAAERMKQMAAIPSYKPKAMQL